MRKLIAVAAVFFAVAAFAQDAKTLADQALSEYYAKHFARSAELFRAAIATGNATPTDYYNGACSMSLAGLKDEAFATLQALAKKGYSNADQLAQDSDLNPLHDDPRWTALLASVRGNAAAYAKKWDAPGIVTPYQENLSNEEKIAGLSRAWSEARYNFANFDLVPELDWDALYLATIPRALATKSTLAYYDVLTAFVAQLHDGHTGVWMPKQLLDVRYGLPAVRLEMIDGHVVVVRTGDTGGAVRVGDEIVTVDGQPWRAYADANVTPYVSASTPQDREHRTAGELLFGPAGSKVTLGVRGADGAVRTVALERFGRANRVPLTDGPFELRMLPGNVAYVALNEFETSKAADEFDKHWDEISKARALILDVRNNGGGSTSNGYRILSTLIDKPVAATRGWKTVYVATDRARRQPMRSEFEESKVGPDAKGRHYTGPVAVLIGPATFSAAEDFGAAWKMMKRGLTIGMPSGGSTGQPLFFNLPGGGGMRICTKRDRYADGSEFVGVGIQPDIVVKQTLEDFRAGRDPVLDRAVAALAPLSSTTTPPRR